MLEPWSIPEGANAIHEPSRCPRFPLLLHELSRARKLLGAPEPPPVRLLRTCSSQQSSLPVLSYDCDARLESSINHGYGSRLPTRAIWRSLLRPHYAGSGVASCPKPWVNARHAVLGDEAKYVLGDIGVKGPHIPWPAILSARLLISLEATPRAATRKYAHTPSVKDQGWRRARAVVGLQSSQTVRPGRRSYRMWICINCIVLVQPREPSPAILIEPVPLRGSGFSSIRSGLSSNAQRLVCPSESTTHTTIRVGSLASHSAIIM